MKNNKEIIERLNKSDSIMASLDGAVFIQAESDGDLDGLFGSIIEALVNMIGAKKVKEQFNKNIEMAEILSSMSKKDKKKLFNNLQK
ncbi:MAG: hypothetical protein NC483_00455 [Ruminococcus sp.]|nr:hypothetical protein [Ruminococcus sp.]